MELTLPVDLTDDNHDEAVARLRKNFGLEPHTEAYTGASFERLGGGVLDCAALVGVGTDCPQPAVRSASAHAPDATAKRYDLIDMSIPLLLP